MSYAAGKPSIGSKLEGQLLAAISESDFDSVLNLIDEYGNDCYSEGYGDGIAFADDTPLQ